MKKLFFAVVVLAAMVVGAVLYGFTAEDGKQKKEYLTIGYHIINYRTANFAIYYPDGTSEEIPIVNVGGASIKERHDLINKFAKKGWRLIISRDISISHMERDVN